MLRSFHWSVTAVVNTGAAEKSHQQTVMTRSRDELTARQMFKEYLSEVGWELVEFEDTELLKTTIA